MLQLTALDGGEQREQMGYTWRKQVGRLRAGSPRHGQQFIAKLTDQNLPRLPVIFADGIVQSISLHLVLNWPYQYNLSGR